MLTEDVFWLLRSEFQNFCKDMNFVFNINLDSNSTLFFYSELVFFDKNDVVGFVFCVSAKRCV